MNGDSLKVGQRGKGSSVRSSPVVFCTGYCLESVAINLYLQFQITTYRGCVDGLSIGPHILVLSHNMLLIACACMSACLFVSLFSCTRVYLNVYYVCVL